LWLGLRAVVIALAAPACSSVRPLLPIDAGAEIDVGAADLRARDLRPQDANAATDARPTDAPAPEAKASDLKPDAPAPDVKAPDLKPDAPAPDAKAPDLKPDAPAPDMKAADLTLVDLKPPADTTPVDAYPPAPALVTIPAGSFTMGSPVTEPCRTTYEDLHPVTLTHSFEMHTTEVTADQFLAVMGFTHLGFPACKGCPLTKVNWHEAAAYCNTLSAKQGLSQCYVCTGSGTWGTSPGYCTEAALYVGQQIYSCPGFRMPTEAEWEYAYRAGTQTAFYNGANAPATCDCQFDANADQIAWYCGNATLMQPVAQKQPNQWGLYDMAGNVAEWCHDVYHASLGAAALIDPVGLDASGRVGGFYTSLVTRGGPAYTSTTVSAAVIRAAAREAVGPTSIHPSLGFRCVRTITP